jgi:heme-degrading monooxygenase HmoA
MIARVWHGFTKPEHADAYESHLKPELLPGLSQKKGFRGSYLLRRAIGDEIEFITIILWDSLDDVRAILAQDYETAEPPASRAFADALKRDVDAVLRVLKRSKR